MKAGFWVVLVLGFVLVNDVVVHWVLAATLGGMSLSDAFASATRFFTVESFVFASAFRAKPFVALALVVLVLKPASNHAAKCALWAALATIMAVHFYGFWVMLVGLFTDARMSSTAALDLIFVPIGAVVAGFMVGALAYVVASGVPPKPRLGKG